MGKYFGTDGFRGEANVSLTAEHAYKIGRFLGWYYGRDKKARFVMGKDTRLSGDMLESALTSGLTASGADVYLLHVTTTPSVAYLVKREGFDCGIMISASHNPFYDNGIKLVNCRGQKMEASVEDQIEAYIDGEGGELPLAAREAIGRSIEYPEGKALYVDYLKSIPESPVRQREIALDCSNGSASDLAGQVFAACGIPAEILFCEPDGVNINRDCGSTHISRLQEYVKEHGLDAGFAYDGDADRCLAVDEKGHLVDGDLILFICGKYLDGLGRLPGHTIVTTVMSNMGLYKACERDGLHTEQTAVGDKYVCENMNANGYALGGEQSGHVIFREFATTGDGMLTSLMLLEVMNATGRSLSSLAEEVRIYPQLLKNIRVVNKTEARENPSVQAAVAAVAEKLGENGRILVRESGTEPLIRVMVEAENDDVCLEMVDSVIDVIRNEGLAAE
ncbi:MAG: phosphoglucosamine mutase [Lachnospiraceae bacterium]|nr:phosphoglucosamine mutase [Lachnospiraceae bacterium]